MERKLIKQREGITLIALVVTIVVLLILAGVSITAVFGENGIINGAQKAKDKTDETVQQEQEDVGELVNKLDEVRREGLPNTVKEAIQKGTIFTVNKQIKDETGKTMTVPKGFKVKEGTTIDEGIVIADSEGNEFVWVPCTVDEYKKHEYNNTNKNDAGTSLEDLNNGGWNTYSYRAYSDWKDDEIDEAANKKSVQNNGGFYIARYEAGVPKEATSFYVDASSDNKTYQTSKNTIGSDLKPVSKKGAQAWNLISQTNALKVSGRMYSGETYGVRSQLVDGTAWDTTVTWMSKEYEGIEKDSTTHGNYANNSAAATRITESNCLWAEHLYKYKKEDSSNVGWCIGKTYQYGQFTSGYKTNWTDAESNASSKYNSYSSDTNTYKYNHYVEMATGASDNAKLKNIYDMAGNMYEWTTEYGYHNGQTSGTKYAVRRGGSFSSYGSDSPVSIRRGNVSASDAGRPEFGFRVVLYVK